ncbi:hypothetical protein LguiA_032248 [Lonicera macranthoides]
MDLSEGEILDEETLALFLEQLDYSDPKDMERFWKAHDAWQARFGETETTKVETICGSGRARVVVRGSGSFDDDPFLGRFCCAAIDKFNRLRQYKFARALEATAYGCCYTLYCITFEATTEAGYTETFKAEVNCDTEDEVEVVNIECGGQPMSTVLGTLRLVDQITHFGSHIKNYKPPPRADSAFSADQASCCIFDESKSQNDGSPTMKEKELEISGRCHCRTDEGDWEGKEGI